MQIGTHLKDSRNNVECVLYGNAGETAVVFSPAWLNKEHCEVVRIPWEFLKPTGQIAPIGAIPTKYVVAKNS